MFYFEAPDRGGSHSEAVVDLEALRDLRDTVNWGKRIAARPVKRSVMPTESWSPMGGLGGESDQRQQRSCRTSCRSHLARGEVSELPPYLNSFSTLTPKNLLGKIFSCQLEVASWKPATLQPVLASRL